MTVLAGCGEGQPVGVEERALHPAGKPGSGNPAVSSTDPSGAPVDTTLVVRILGSGYDAGSTAEFAIDEQPVPQVRTNSTTFVSSKELRASITIDADAPTALYDVVVRTSGGKRGIGIEKFEVFYTAVPLGTLGGVSFAYDVNAHGEVSGISEYRRKFGPWHAFFWSAEGGMEDLGLGNANDISDGSQVVGERGSDATIWTPTGPANWLAEYLPVPAGNESIARAISPQGSYIVGSTGSTSPWSSPAVWTISGTGWVLSLLPAPSVPGQFASAADVNDDGLIAGESNKQGYTWSFEAGSWVAHELLMPLNAPNGVFVRAINALGDVLGGTCCEGTEIRPIIWRRTASGWSPPEEVPAIPPGSSAESMNDAGWIAGAYIDSGGDIRAYIYRGGSFHDLGTPGGSSSIAWGVGSAGHVVGQGGSHSSGKAYMWALP